MWDRQMAKLLSIEVEVDPSFNDPEPVYMNPSNPDPWESRA